MPAPFTFYMERPSAREGDLRAQVAHARRTLGWDGPAHAELRDPARAVTPPWAGFAMTAPAPFAEALDCHGWRVRVTLAPPREGERGWFLPPAITWTAEAALAVVLRDAGTDGEAQYGWRALKDHESPDEDGDIVVTITLPDPSIEEIRARLAARPRDPEDGEICEDPACPGWDVFEMEGQIRQRTPAESPDGLHEIQRCDICCPEGLSDADLARLPEAQAALALACEAPEPRPVDVTIRVMTDAALRDVVAIVHACIRGSDDFTIMDDAITVSEVTP